MLPVPYIGPTMSHVQESTTHEEPLDVAPSNIQIEYPPPLATYQRRVQVVNPTLPEEPHEPCPTQSSTHTTEPPDTNSDWPIAIRKGTQSTHNL